MVDGLLIEHGADGVLRLTLDRPAKRNAIDDAVMTGLIDAVDAANRDEAVRAILLSGAGEHFCSGADIVARNAPTGERPRVGSIQRRVPSLAHRLIPLLCTVQVPVVCAAQGYVAGIGLHLAVAADFTVAAEDATFWEPFGQRGFTPDSGGTWLLPRRVGMARARELLVLGRRLSGTGPCRPRTFSPRRTSLRSSSRLGPRWPSASPSGSCTRVSSNLSTPTSPTRPSRSSCRPGARTSRGDGRLR